MNSPAEIGTQEGQTAVLHPATSLGAVQLTVSNLARSLAFYQQVLGFQLHDLSDGQANLGVGGTDLLELVELPNARHVTHHSGLYHFAVLTPSRLALAQVLHSLAVHGIPIGGSDHLVSEAIYLADPDGNGIEIYRDRPRSQWRYEKGCLVMGGLPLDYQGILRELADEAEPWSGLDPATVIGHIHLHVGQLRAALEFYTQVIGFDLVTTWNQAAFYAAGGYHHHLATNTWAGVGIPPQPADAVGLRHYVIQLVNATEKAALIERLEQAGVAFTGQTAGLFVHDPAQNGILFRVPQH